MRYRILLLLSILAIATFLSGFNGFATSLQYQAISEQWQYASVAAPPGLMAQVEEENFDPNVAIDPGRMKLLHIIMPNQPTPLYIINSRLEYECPPSGCSDAANPLCGWKGTCTYFIYISDHNAYRRILRDEFNPLRPSEVKEPFIAASDRLVNGLPCLRFSEVTSSLSAKEVQQRIFCYDGSNYLSIALK